MTYKINGTDLSLQPSTGRWQSRDALDIRGDGATVYPSVRSFELSWDLMSVDEFNQLYGFYQTFELSGTVVAELPLYAGTPWSFYAYSGCVISEPESQDYFEQFYTRVNLLVTNIRT